MFTSTGGFNELELDMSYLFGLAHNGAAGIAELDQHCQQAGIDVDAYTMAYGTSYDEFERTDRLCGMLGIEARRVVVDDVMAGRVEDYLREWGA